MHGCAMRSKVVMTILPLLPGLGNQFTGLDIFDLDQEQSLVDMQAGLVLALDSPRRLSQ